MSELECSRSSAQFSSSPQARTAARAFFADYAALATLPVTRAELRALDVPIALLESPGAPHYLDTAVRALAELLPDVERGPAHDVAGSVRALLART